MTNVTELLQIAKQSGNIPVGLNDPLLSANPEKDTLYYRFLYLLVYHFKPEVVVECGIYMGTATRYMALANPDTLVIGVDKEPHPACERYTNLPNIRIVIGDTAKSADAVSKLIGDKKIGLLFLDSEHDGMTPTREFIAYSKLFADECIVAADDIAATHLSEINRKAMRTFWGWMPGEKLSLHFLHPSYGGVVEPGFGVSIVRSGEYR